MAEAELRPVSLAKEGNSLLITWSDGVTLETTFRDLRDACPCALCRERKEAQAPPQSTELLPVLTTPAGPLEVTAMEPTGNYGYNVHFSDGHNKGIFTFQLLRELGTPRC